MARLRELMTGLNVHSWTCEEGVKWEGLAVRDHDKDI